VLNTNCGGPAWI